MDHRPPLPGAAIRRPPAPQRAVSGGSYGQLAKRTPVPSRLSVVRSISQPANVVDLTAEVAEVVESSASVFLGNKEHMVTSPVVIDMEDDDNLAPPAKRTKTVGSEFQQQSIGVPVIEERDGVDKIVPGSPVSSSVLAGLSKKKAGNGASYRASAATAARKSSGLEPPAIATRAPPPKKVLDFSPWSGNNPEDVLTETVIKNGYADSLKTTGQSECASAKASIWPNMSQKNHQGLSMLGYLFTAVMEKRQALGRCTVPSTFRPPPRVTVTDTKREAWLRDLADINVPLRRQSRTIPHGIRGKLLMEQCLTKSIPLQRAVWLAKCVGANELRAFRRKGISGNAAAVGEIKWVREWTIHVEQFVESVISMCGQEAWQPKMNYAVKLTAAFFAEELLDMDHYLDWIVSGLTEAKHDRLPIWLVLTQLFWKPLTAQSTRGRALAVALLEHLRQIVSTSAGGPVSLKERLQKLVAVLAVSNTGCLILPRVWHKYKALLSPKLSAGASANSPAIDVKRRNERLATTVSKSGDELSSPLLQLFSRLDRVGLDANSHELLGQCRAIISDPEKLVTSVLHWASSPYRTGKARIYVASSIIANTRLLPFDTDGTILRYLTHLGSEHEGVAEKVFRIVVDLMQKDAFSTGTYLQRLISDGLLASQDGGSHAARLLTALPTRGLPSHVSNTLGALLRRLGYSPRQPGATTGILEEMNTTVSDAHVGIKEVVSQLSLSSQFDLATDAVARSGVMAKTGGLSLAAFCYARQIVECVGDLRRLAELVSIAALSEHAGLLATACDTVNYHARTFAAFDSLAALHRAFGEQYLSLRTQQPLDQNFIHALRDLTSRLQDQERLNKILAKDLVICGQQNFAAVCSPASDNLIGMQLTSLEHATDIDAVFASGNTMDEHLMQRVFTRVIQYAVKLESSPLYVMSRPCGWLRQLRLLDDGKVFDQIVHSYLSTTFRAANDEIPVRRTIDVLAASGSVRLSQVATLAKEACSPDDAAVVLRVILSKDVAGTRMSDLENHRLLLEKERCQSEDAKALTGLFRLAAESPTLDTEDPDLLQYIILQHSQASGSVRCFFDHGNPSPVLCANIGRLIVAFLQVDASAVNDHSKLDLSLLVDTAGPLSVLYCAEAIKWMRYNTSWTTAEDDTLRAAVLRKIQSGSEVWPQLLHVAGDNVKLRMHDWAKDQLLALIGSMEVAIGSEAEAHLQRCLDVLVFAKPTASIGDDSAVVKAVCAGLKDIEAQLNNERLFEGDHHLLSAKREQSLHILLRIGSVYIHDIHEESDASKTARVQLLAGLCSLVVTPELQARRDTTEYLIDVASTLADSLHVAESTDKAPVLSKFTADPRLTFILGTSSNVAGPWLALASQHPQVLSQQQRVLGRQPSQPLQPQMAARTSAPAQSGHLQPPPQMQRWPSQGGPLGRPDVRMPVEMKITPFTLRRWEVMPDAAPQQGENDASLSLSLFAARKV